MGHDVTLFVTPPSTRLVCALCHKVCEDALRTPCHHVFCRDCIIRHVTHRHECPIDKRKMDLVALFKDDLIDGIISDYKVKCAQSGRGCSHVGDLGSSSKHAHMCGYVEVPCPHRGCAQSIPKNALEDHKAQCQSKPARCDKCYGYFFSNLLPLHQSVCEGDAPEAAPCLSRDCEFTGNPRTDGYCSVCYLTRHSLPVPASLKCSITPEEEELYMKKYTLSRLQIAIAETMLRDARVPSPLDLLAVLLLNGCKLGEKGIAFKDSKAVLRATFEGHKRIDPDVEKLYFHVVSSLIVDYWNIPKEWEMPFCVYAEDRPSVLARGKTAAEAGPPSYLVLDRIPSGMTLGKKIVVPFKSLDDDLEDLLGRELDELASMAQGSPGVLHMIIQQVKQWGRSFSKLAEDNYGDLVLTLLLHDEKPHDSYNEDYDHDEYEGGGSRLDRSSSARSIGTTDSNYYSSSENLMQNMPLSRSSSSNIPSSASLESIPRMPSSTSLDYIAAQDDGPAPVDVSVDDGDDRKKDSNERRISGHDEDAAPVVDGAHSAVTTPELKPDDSAPVVEPSLGSLSIPDLKADEKTNKKEEDEDEGQRAGEEKEKEPPQDMQQEAETNTTIEQHDAPVADPALKEDASTTHHDDVTTPLVKDKEEKAEADEGQPDPPSLSPSSSLSDDSPTLAENITPSESTSQAIVPPSSEEQAIGAPSPDAAVSSDLTPAADRVPAIQQEEDEAPAAPQQLQDLQEEKGHEDGGATTNHTNNNNALVPANEANLASSDGPNPLKASSEVMDSFLDSTFAEFGISASDVQMLPPGDGVTTTESDGSAVPLEDFEALLEKQTADLLLATSTSSALPSGVVDDVDDSAAEEHVTVEKEDQETSVPVSETSQQTVTEAAEPVLATPGDNIDVLASSETKEDGGVVKEEDQHPEQESTDAERLKTQEQKEQEEEDIAKREVDQRQAEEEARQLRQQEEERIQKEQEQREEEIKVQRETEQREEEARLEREKMQQEEEARERHERELQEEARIKRELEEREEEARLRREEQQREEEARAQQEAEERVRREQKDEEDRRLREAAEAEEEARRVQQEQEAAERQRRKQVEDEEAEAEERRVQEERAAARRRQQEEDEREELEYQRQLEEKRKQREQAEREEEERTIREEAERKRAMKEEEDKKRQEDEEERARLEQEERARIQQQQQEAEEKAKREEEEKQRHEEDARKQRLKEEEEERTRFEEEKAKREEEERRKREDEEGIKREEEERARLEEEEKARLEKEKALRDAEEEARLRREQEEKEMLQREEEERAKREEEARLQQEDEARIKRADEEENLRRQVEEARIKREERLKREEEDRVKREEEAQAKREAQERLQREEEEARVKRQTEEDADAAEERRIQEERAAARRRQQEDEEREEQEYLRKKEAERRRREQEEEEERREEEEYQRKREERRRQIEQEDREEQEREMRETEERRRRRLVEEDEDDKEDLAAKKARERAQRQERLRTMAYDDEDDDDEGDS
eukprot:TRINITY_DN1412_c0_g1_i8.p1 TRINITY_DN1412_c0_g1~~TRINITY_DN1412_c0_g1_i8.p1  ORF type:complete len:1509 (-),score=571.90 TRINITY_DN1412_c0_g1_i8:31-4557(-)